MSKSGPINEDLDLVIEAREKDLGGFSVRRILPYATHRMVGPFIFFDHMGPASFDVGHGIDVRPHPHVNLATVTYLFEGSILHRDSLGTTKLIEPGAINWMTAGRGIVHSERSPQDARARGAKLHGIQCWVALPQEYEEIEPSFAHHSAASLPDFEVNNVRLRLLLGTGFGVASPEQTLSDIIYAEAKFKAGQKLTVPADGGRDLAAYIVTGEARIDGVDMKTATMAVAASGRALEIEAISDAHVMIIGGKPLPGKRYIYWNFVSSREDRIEQAKKDWADGRFPAVPGDDREFIPLPDDSRLKTNPPGTIM